MYVLCVGMYRACSTWQYEVVADLLERRGLGRRLGYLTGDQFAAIEGQDDDGGWKVLKSHEEHGRFSRALAEGRALAVYAHRDVRDVAFSLSHKRKLSFETLVTQGMVHQVLANDRFWSRQPRTIIQRYDRLVADPAAGVGGLAAHLGIDLEPGEAAAIAAEYSFQANRNRTIALGQTLRRGGVDLDDPSIAQAHDRRTLLHWNHMREGRVGEWRERATPRQRLALARICGAWLAGHGYDADDPGDIAEDLATEPATLADRARWEWAMARGRVACELRCLSLRHPRLARSIKPWLGIAPEAPVAPKAPLVEPGRHDGKHPVPPPHFAQAQAQAQAGENAGVRPGTLNPTL